VRRGPAGSAPRGGDGVLAGCSDDQRADATSTTTASTTTEPSTPSTTSPGYVDVAPYEDGTGSVSFTEPDGDISCAIFSDEPMARCDVYEAEWNPPTPPADCLLDYGNVLVVETEAGRFQCAGDAVGNPDEVLDDGSTLRYGPFTCASTAGTIACTNTETGHGFSVSKSEYDFL
jgi:hypothetical protein